MSILIVFTHPSSINDMRHALKERVDVGNLTGTPILRFDEDANEFRAHETEMDSGLFFVSDNHSKSREQLENYLPQDRSDVFVLKHQSPDYNIDRIDQAKNVEVGHHIIGDRFYQSVFDILIDDRQDKFSRIFETVFPQILSIKLKLLHECLLPQNAPRRLPPELDEQYADAYEEFWEAAGGGLDDELLTQTDPFDRAYLAALSNLRDALLA